MTAYFVMPKLQFVGPPETGTVTLPPEARGALGPSPLSVLRARGRVRGALALLGPAFVAAVAYIDPGNFATNIEAGAKYGYMLVWVIVAANLMAMLVQYLSAKVGVATGRSLPELCRDHFPRPVSWGLWLQAEAIAMATDLAEFVGAALGLYLLFGIPLFPAGVITAVVAFGILALEQRGYRRFELAIMGLLGLVLLGFAYDFLSVGGSAGDAAAGLVPHLAGGDSVLLAVGIIGGATKVHLAAKAAIQLIGIKTASELAEIIVSVGLAQNMAALRALATEGIQRGHMSLHARQVAVAAGAEGEMIEKVAAQMVAEKTVRIDRAEELLKEWGG